MPDPVTISDILDKAADLIEPEGAWTQGPFAADKNGVGVTPGSMKATCWCASGAIERAARGYWDNPAYRRARVFADALTPCDNIVEFNEDGGRTQAEVVAKLREAAGKAREQGL